MIRNRTNVGEIANKFQEMRLRWYGHVMRREENYVGSGGGVDRNESTGQKEQRKTYEQMVGQSKG